jgi:hypothetical protein
MDPLKLVREGTSQDGRASAALNPASAPVDGQSMADRVVFAQGYAQLLKYFDAQNSENGDWSAFFGSDVSAVLAVAATEDVEAYKTSTRTWFDFLNNLRNKGKTASLARRFGWLYAAVGQLAAGLDALKEALPPEIALKGVLRSMIRTQLAPALGRLIGYYKAGKALAPPDLIFDTPTPNPILRRPSASFAGMLAQGLSAEWSGGAPWAAYVAGISADASVYGPPGDVFTRINHCTTHNLFKAVFDQFLKGFARAVGEAEKAFEGTLTDFDGHQPHYALYLAFLQLFERARASGNGLTERHLDFYYRTILGLKEKPSEPGRALLLGELAKGVTSRHFPEGELFKAGKDSQGKDAVFANDRDFVANQAKVARVANLYRHLAERTPSDPDDRRIFAAPIADSDDGLGAPLTSPDGSWHPFYDKVYIDGALDSIRMPPAEIGFAVASHELLLREGPREIRLNIEATGYAGADWADLTPSIQYLLTTKEGWLEVPADFAIVGVGPDGLMILLELTGAEPPIEPYSAKVHGYAFQTDLPMLLVKLRQDESLPYAYPAMQDMVATKADIWVRASRLKTLAISNDFGPVDPSKPFQPFGSAPVSGSSLVIGSKEVFQKNVDAVTISLSWQVQAVFYTKQAPKIAVDLLTGGDWRATGVQQPLNTGGFSLADAGATVRNAPDFTPNEPFGTESRQGFLRLRLTDSLGQAAYQTALIAAIAGQTAVPTPQPVAPVLASATLAYRSSASLRLDTSSQAEFENRKVQFFHVGPFGVAERHGCLSGGAPISLMPQFRRDDMGLTSEAELYIGISGLIPPQDLALLFQVVDGTANPLAIKPKPHIHWSYLKDDAWTAFEKTAVRDSTGEILQSGIVVLSVPRDATSDNTLMPGGLYWIRAAVHERSDAVCRLQLLAAQATEAVFEDRGNAPDFSATPLPPGRVSKLLIPDPAVKGISQPFPSFGGRGAEPPAAFYTRVSERLRHKDRAIDLWDYERLILEAFPQVYKAKCLNHTCYEPNDAGTGIYRELAPGHVTIVTIPKLHAQQQRDPLKPYTSLGVLQDIKAFLEKRTNCFAQLHVKNPQFEAIRARFAVRLRDGFDETFYTLQLKQAITRFLSPWAFADAGAPTFGGKVYKSVLINFVEEQSYVDYVTDFQMFRDRPSGPGTEDLDEAAGSTAASILVAAPASKHDITVIRPAQEAPLAEACECGT